MRCIVCDTGKITDLLPGITSYQVGFIAGIASSHHMADTDKNILEILCPKHETQVINATKAMREGTVSQ